MFDPALVSKINLGRCFALVGSGPSSEIGYPSWEGLAKDVWAQVIKKTPTADSKSFESFMAKKDYPAAFRQAEVDLGSRANLVSVVRTCFVRKPLSPTHPIYEYLAKWPFACYLTTNYDNELQAYLSKAGQHYQPVQNRIEDLAVLRDGASHLIVKLHADLDHAEHIVLTSQDYDKFLTSPQVSPFRAKLQQVFAVFDVFIVGHSITDPDLQWILATAKHTADPKHPIFMVLANATPGEQREFREKYNIRLLSYEDTDNSHRELKSHVVMADRFISPRGTISASVPSCSDDEIRTASSLLIFRRLRTIGSDEPVNEALGPLVLSAIDAASHPLSVSQVLAAPVLAPFANSIGLAESVQQSIFNLEREGLLKATGLNFSLSPKGLHSLQTASSERNLEEHQAYGQFRVSLQQKLPTITAVELEQAVKVLRDCLVGCFRARGLSLANVIISGQSVATGDLSDLFREITDHARQFAKPEQRAAFVEAAHAFLVEPNEPQRRYLASVSQGFFLYHLTGLDVSCARIRKDLFLDTCWFLDSSVILPMLAKGCHAHEYARDLFARLSAVKASLYTTQMLLGEAWYHLKWAKDFVNANPVDSPEFLLAAMARENYKHNLFIDGYVRTCADGTVNTFSDYLQFALPKGTSEESLAQWCTSQGVRALEASELKGFQIIHWGDIEEFKAVLTEKRKASGTFRNEYQVEAEAEALAIIRRLRTKEYTLPGRTSQPVRIYFVSQSRVLDKAAQNESVITWSPEAVYRYVTTLPGNALNADFLQQCMLHQYYYAGVSFIDKARYHKFFGPSINQAKISYRDQVEHYIAETEQNAFREDFDRAFDSTPDLEKPFFVAQMGWQLARAAEVKAKRTEESAQARIASVEEGRRKAEDRARHAEEDAEKARKRALAIQHEANRQRNLKDPKHRVKRERQAKERARKKRK